MIRPVYGQCVAMSKGLPDWQSRFWPEPAQIIAAPFCTCKSPVPIISAIEIPGPTWGAAVVPPPELPAHATPEEILPLLTPDWAVVPTSGNGFTVLPDRHTEALRM